ncbi:hypothetical protein, partial [Vibrio vulnificus]|uniref:hypothetical protein n=1 Tax=Vibrio vulnificus TaxID=672 RepID=UPI001C10983A
KISRSRPTVASKKEPHLKSGVRHQSESTLSVLSFYIYFSISKVQTLSIFAVFPLHLTLLSATEKPLKLVKHYSLTRITPFTLSH